MEDARGLLRDGRSTSNPFSGNRNRSVRSVKSVGCRGWPHSARYCSFASYLAVRGLFDATAAPSPHPRTCYKALGKACFFGNLNRVLEIASHSTQSLKGMSVGSVRVRSLLLVLSPTISEAWFVGKFL